MTRPRYFVIFGAMRTGSNLLERTLDQYEGLIGLGELYNPAFIGGPKRVESFGFTLAERDRDPIGFLDHVISAHPGRTPGFRVFNGHDPRLIDHAARDPACARFLLSRDPLQSYLSLRIAAETGQWMLGPNGERRTARVTFEPEAFKAYRTRLAAHYDQVRSAMRAAGATAFEIDYEDLLNLDAMNGAARHAGAASPRDRLDPPILRQNSPDPAERVTNPEALAPFLEAAAAAQRAEPKLAFDALGALLVARGSVHVYAPIPGALDRATTAFLESAAGAGNVGLRPVQTDRRRRRGAFVFSVVRRPAERLRDVFEAMVLISPKAPFPELRAALERQYGAPPAAAALTDVAAAGRGFDAFLEFAADSIAGRAAHPPHPAWAPQSDLLAAYAAETPVDFIARTDRIAADAAYLAARLGFDDADDLLRKLVEATKAPTLVELTPQREARVRAVYARDFNRLGFGDAYGEP